MRCREHSITEYGRSLGWAIDPYYVNEVCEQCDNKGIVIGIGNREMLCDERCEKCGKQVHVIAKRMAV